MTSFTAYFFAYETDIPDGVGFSLFGPAHLFWLFGLLAGIAAFVCFYRRRTPKVQRRASYIVGAAVLFLQVIQAAFFMIRGVYGVYTLPLHLCSMAAYFIFLHLFFHPKWYSEILFYPLLPGAFMALLFPDWTKYPALSFMSCAGFLVHGFMILYICMKIADGSVSPAWKRIYAPVIFIFAYALPIIAFDHAENANYGFLNVPSPGSPLVFIASVFGYGIGYYVGYALLVFGVMLLNYSLFAAARILLRKLSSSIRSGTRHCGDSPHRN
ncbi:MAG TPA: YwaF family protein [Lachnospiraceae bacterium]|nr:YwaF family protein [Lachnospiraceae bacterium]